MVRRSATCGWANRISGWRASGNVLTNHPGPAYATVFGNCSGLVTAHEIGHLMGLGHSFAQGEVGTLHWSRGHGVRNEFHTVMAYASAYGSVSEAGVFSSPDLDCDGFPCGVDRDRTDGADAATTLNAVRFQVARFAESKPDSDGDGFVDPADDFPDDSGDWVDSDGDGIGDNADDDDDNDGVADVGDAFPLDPSEWSDADRDGVGDVQDAFPDDPEEMRDTDGDGVGDNGDAFPYDSSETTDTDSDGVGNNADAFPYDTREWADTDGDGIGNNADLDDDGDGVPDSDDAAPLDHTRTELRSYRFLASGYAPRVAGAGDVDGDGRADLLIAHSDMVYLLAAIDLAAADAADGMTDREVDLENVARQPGSYKFVGGRLGRTPNSVGAAGDLDGDGLDDVVLADVDWSNTYVVSASALPDADAADGLLDGIVSSRHIAGQINCWRLAGETPHDGAGHTLSMVGDVDGDGLPNLAIGAPWDAELRGAVYVVSLADLAAADAADGSVDGVVGLGHAAEQPDSWKLVGETERDRVGKIAPVGHSDNLGRPGLAIGAINQRHPAVYLLAAADLEGADGEDGDSDGVVDLGLAVAQPNSRKLVGEALGWSARAASVGDLDGDDVDDLVVTGYYVYLISRAAIEPADGAEGANDGVVVLSETAIGTIRFSFEVGATTGDMDGDGLADVALSSGGPAAVLSGRDLLAVIGRPAVRLDEMVGHPRTSWKLEYPRHQLSVSFVGDADGDGLADISVRVEGDTDSALLLVSSDFAALDQADGLRDSVLSPLQATGDADGDGRPNVIDWDDDNDGHDDHLDRWPLDASEWSDRDNDGVGDNADDLPDDWREQLDTDGDGVGDRSDEDDDGDGVEDGEDDHPLDTDNDGVDNATDPDDDNDGVEDTADAFPLDATESNDADGDGIGDNADPDDDNDGVPDGMDDLPLDPGDSIDTDGDGIGDNDDAFADDPGEWTDHDADGTGDNADTDDDNDGVPDADDAFPLDAGESRDTDGDGVGDNADAFPGNPSEWADTDADGVGDNADTDGDGDGYTDPADHFPRDAERTRLFYFRLAGESTGSLTGYSVLSDNLRDEGVGEAFVGAPELHQGEGAVYVVSGDDLNAADAADAVRDHVVELRRIAGLPSSASIVGGTEDDGLGESLSPVRNRAVNNGAAWLIGAEYRGRFSGSATLVTHTDLVEVDHGTDGIVEIDALIGQPGSWEFVGESSRDRAGFDVAWIGDVHGDGQEDILIGAPLHGDGYRGAAYLVSGAGLAAADAADGVEDARIQLGTLAAQPGSWKFQGDAGDRAGTGLGSVGDIDGDGLPDLVIGASRHSARVDEEGAIYLVTVAGLASADGADGSEDGVIQLGGSSNVPGWWKLVGERVGDQAGFVVSSSDMNGDSTPELVIGAPGNAGAIYIISLNDLEQSDSADGDEDNVVNLGSFLGGTSWKLAGDGVAIGGTLSVSDIDDDGATELIVGDPSYTEGAFCPTPGRQRRPGAVHVISGSDLAVADAADGSVDRVATLSDVPLGRSSWLVLGERMDALGWAVSAGADLDGREGNDLVLGAARQVRPYGACGVGPGEGLAVVLSSADLPVADRLDGAEDRIIDLGRLRDATRAVDHDFDGLDDESDPDDDNDGVADADDAQPLDPQESLDSDHDGIGDRRDPDDDNDGVVDGLDAFPLDPYETADNDADGVGDNRDPDDDNDGVDDVEDAFPFDSSEWTDSDGDGIGDNSDPYPDDPASDNDGDGISDRDDPDDDNDGVADVDDMFPRDAARQDLFFLTIVGVSSELSAAPIDFDGDGLADVAAFSTMPSRALRSVRLISAKDLTDADAADGTVDRVIDATLESDTTWTIKAWTAASAGDVDQDGREDILLQNGGSIHLLSAAVLAGADSSDGTADRRIDPEAAFGSLSGIWRLVGTFEDASAAVSRAMDLDGDGHRDLLVGTRYWWNADVFGPGVAYVASGADLLTAADEGRIDLDAMAGQIGSWKLLGQGTATIGASIAADGDIDGDGRTDLLLGAPRLADGTNPHAGAVYVLSGLSMNDVDAADGTMDGTIELPGSPQDGISRLVGDGAYAGRLVSTAGDVDGDGLADLLVVSGGELPNASGSGYHPTPDNVYVIAAKDLSSADAADGAFDGVIRLGAAASQPGSLAFGGDYWVKGALAPGDVDDDGLSDLLIARGDGAWLISGVDLPALARKAEHDVVSLGATVPRNSWILRVAGRRGTRISLAGEVWSAGDMNGDGKSELILGGWERGGGETRTFQYILSLAELAAADAADGRADRVIYLDRVADRWVPR